MTPPSPIPHPIWARSARYAVMPDLDRRVALDLLPAPANGAAPGDSDAPIHIDLPRRRRRRAA